MIVENLVCPCEKRTPLNRDNDGKWFCGGPDCAYGENGKRGFPLFRETPVLIPFQCVDTVCDEAAYPADGSEAGAVQGGSESGRHDAYISRRSGQMAGLLRKIIWGTNKVTARNSRDFLARLKEDSQGKPRVLVIGSGSVGAGAGAIHADSGIELTGVDIYASPSVDFICDAHYLPFPDEAFDGIWIQAVLEHVQDPEKAVREIHRILRPGGVIYAETPFMQQVHEGGYDFSRFTAVGHRNLFRNFDETGSGAVAGPGVTLAWAFRYFFIALFRSRRAGTIIALPFQLVCRLLDGLVHDDDKLDGASCLWFMGRKSEETSLTAKQVVEIYKGRF